MNETSEWNALNENYLQEVTNWLKLKLELFIDHPNSDTLADKIANSTRKVRRYEAMQTPPAPVVLSQEFQLTRFEHEVLLFCLCIELDPQISVLCANAHGNSNLAYPTYALAMSLFDEPNWGALSPDRPLRYWRIIDVGQRNNRPLTTTPLQIDERILSYVKGLNYLDHRLHHLIRPLQLNESERALSASQQELVSHTVNSVRQYTGSNRMPIIQLLGAHQANKRLIAWHLGKELGLSVYYLEARLIPQNTVDLDIFVRLWQRETILLPVAIYLDAFDADTEEGDTLPRFQWFLNRSVGRFLLDSRDIQTGLSQETIDLDIHKPTRVEQQMAWGRVLQSEDDSEQISSRLSGQFNLDFSTISSIAQSLQAGQPIPEESLPERLWSACLVETRPRMDTLAQRVDARATWDDIILPDVIMGILREIVNQVRYRSVVYDNWGFWKRLNRGLGMIALFTGESGTGKTMAAEVLANDLKLNLYRIDLSAVVSKYIGETEKNLRHLFDAAEDGGAILFFDEADALFGKRSQVKDSHDRYANIETNYLLQRLEAYHGLAILATNMKSSMDEAFLRRIRFAVTFPIPEKNYREKIWRQVFPTETPLGDLHYSRLADFDFPGGSIFNIALNATFMAARDHSPVEMQHIMYALRLEYYKTDRLVNDSLFDL